MAVGKVTLHFCHLVWSPVARARGAGWYWWQRATDPVFHGPFELESDCITAMHAGRDPSEKEMPE